MCPPLALDAVGHKDVDAWERLKAPDKSTQELLHQLTADVARAAGWVGHTCGLAARAGSRMQAELAEIGERLYALHQVALFEGGWCPRCGDTLTDPSRSPSGSRHCRTCQVGWTLTDAEDDQLVRVADRAWPTANASTSAMP